MIARTIKVAVHHSENSFSANWIQFFKEHSISYKGVNCYQSDILDQMEDCQGLMWHWHHTDPKAVQFARALSLSLEMAGKKMFPSAAASWHFDDKVAQKYLLEALDLPFVPTWVFYSEEEALQWVDNTRFPKIFKLKRGAASSNVFLVKTRQEALRRVKTAFGRGYSVVNRQASLRDKLRRFRKSCSFYDLVALGRGAGRLFVRWPIENVFGPERGYAYFQEFLSGNDFDVRVVVIGGRAFCLRRFVRENDFRASGSGNLDYDESAIDHRCIEISQRASRLSGMECCSYDYLFNDRREPLIVEVSYGFPVGPFLDNCPGYWTDSLEWVEGRFNAQAFMAEDFVRSLEKSLAARTGEGIEDVQGRADWSCAGPGNKVSGPITTGFD